MKVLDRYITRELIIPIFFGAITLVFLFLVADLFDNLDELLESKAPLTTILKYYGLLMPFSFVQVIPWASWIGTVFLLLHLGLNNELTAMKAAGLQITTIVKPVLFLGFLIGVFIFLISELVVPKTFKQANDIMQVNIQKNISSEDQEILKNVTYHASGEVLIYFRKFDPSNNRAEDAIVLWLDSQQLNTYKKLFAKKAIFNGTNWDFYNISEYQTNSRGRILGEPNIIPRATYSTITVTPQDIVHASTDNIYLSIFEMKYSINKLKENGVPVTDKLVDFYYRLSVPWQSLLMILITIPFLGPIRTRKAIAITIFACVAVVFAYHIVGAISLALGKAGKIWPLLSAWAHHILFAGLAIFKLEKANH